MSQPAAVGSEAALLQKAEDFAAEITEVLGAVAQTPCPPLVARAAPDGRFAIRQEAPNAIRLTVDNEHLISMRIHYRCYWDQYGKHLAIERSEIKVVAGVDDSKEPLFRYEFQRGLPDHVPGAHLQVHAHRDDLTWLMTRADRNRDGALRRLRDIHFVLGGARFRPCLEDVLEMLINEVGIDCSSDAPQRLHRGRLRWRDVQLRSAVRDHTQAAAEALQELGYTVTPPVDGHRRRDEARIRRL